MPSRDEVLTELDSRLGPVAVMDLVGRDLVATPAAGEIAAVSAEARYRLRGVLTGASVGNALGRPVRYRHSRQIAAQLGRVRDYQPWSGWHGGPVGTVLAEGQELVLYARACVDDGMTPWARFGAGLPAALPTLRDPGQATIDAGRRIAQGTPWFAAGTDSFGAGGILRSAVDALAHPDDPVWRAASASLGAAVTHAHRRAVVASAVAADAIATLALDPARASDPMVFADELAARCPDPALAMKLRTLATQLHNCEPEAEPVLLAALAWVLSAPDAESALVGAVSAGGATHLVGGLVGALAAARWGVQTFPARWLDELEGRSQCDSVAATLLGVDPGPAPLSKEGDAPAHVWFLLDRSGSMKSIEREVVAGFSKYVEEQASAAADALLTLVQFDSEAPHETVIDGVPMAQVRPLTSEQFAPRASTPLYDAIGMVLERVDRHVAGGAHDADQLVVIFTDGLENASRRYSHQEIFDLINLRRTKGWTFVFLGANQDSYETGAAMAMARGSTANWRADSVGTMEAFRSLSVGTSGHLGRSRAEKAAMADRFFEAAEDSSSPPRKRRGSKNTS
jgi:ADP-ribosylglycohydrolase